jgi:hypothetical protein
LKKNASYIDDIINFVTKIWREWKVYND